jgi:hypothetical protein
LLVSSVKLSGRGEGFSVSAGKKVQMPWFPSSPQNCLASPAASSGARGHTLQPTALVNEVYLRLIDWQNATWENRAHFFGVALEITH